MAVDISPRIGLDGEKEFKAALKGINTDLKTLGTEMKLVTSEFNKNATSVKALKAQNEVLTKTYDAQKQKVNELQNQLRKAADAYGTDDKYVKQLTQSLNMAKAEMNNTKSAIDGNTAAIRDNALQTDKWKSGLKAAGTAVAAVGAAAAAAVVAIGKEAVTAYADYEQLVGGVDTLFGDASTTVQKYAANAFKTAGLSANQYMETVTSFSASLIQSLGGDTAAAAQYADMAITDMSDNANKMGTDMQSIQNAYQGFAKQNYTMLDNLKLGYGGTKEEMERLLADAEAFSGIEYDISSYADVVSAIHVIQEEMGIAGATALEASTTISGSFNSAKAAFQNLVTGLADGNADVGELMNNFIESVKTVMANLLPVLQTLMENIFGYLEEHGAEMLVQGVLLLTKLAAGIIKAIPQLIAKIPEVIAAVVNEFKAHSESFAEIGRGIVEGIWNGIQRLASWIKEKVSGFFGGIVDSVKDMLGIHSPSTVFAGIGSNMALGLDEGFAGAMRNVGNSISNTMSGLSSGITVPVTAEARYRSALAGMGVSEGEIVINLTSQIDGAVLARNQYRYNRAEAVRHGGSLVMA